MSVYHISDAHVSIFPFHFFSQYIGQVLLTNISRLYVTWIQKSLEKSIPKIHVIHCFNNEIMNRYKNNPSESLKFATE